MTGDKSERNEQESHSSGTTTAGEDVSMVSIRVGWCFFNPASRKGRALYLMQMLILPFIPIMALIAQNSVFMSRVVRYQAEVIKVASQVEDAMDVGRLLRALQMERTEVAYLVFSNTSLTLRLNLSAVYSRTDRLVESLTRWPDVTGLDDPRTKPFRSRVRFQVRLEDFRDSVNPLDTRATRVVSRYNFLNAVLLDVLTERIQEADAPRLWRLLVSYKNMLWSEEQFGRVMVYGSVYHLRGRLDPEGYLAWAESSALAWAYLNNTLLLSPDVSHHFHTYTTLTATANRLQDSDGHQQTWSTRTQTLKNTNTGASRHQGYEDMWSISGATAWGITELLVDNAETIASLDRADKFLQEMAGFLDSLGRVEAAILSDIQKGLREDLGQAERQLTLGVTLLVLVLVISPIIILLVHRATRLIHVYAANLLKRSSEVRREKRKSDNVLYQLLPRPVAHYLRQQKQVPAEYFESVTIYLSDIVGFTKISSESSPLQVVTLLNALYQLFDDAIEKYDVYKMETIGDAYMVVSGLPNRNGERHATEIAEVALDLRDAVGQFEVPHRRGETLRVRIGLHSGTCVAGVVGTKMPRYCIFGKTVTTAHFLESSGQPMQIHMSEATQDLLAKTGRFVIEYRGTLTVTSRYRGVAPSEAEISTYWLLGYKERTGEGAAAGGKNVTYEQEAPVTSHTNEQEVTSTQEEQTSAQQH